MEDCRKSQLERVHDMDRWIAGRAEHAQTHRISIRVGYMELRI